MSGGKKMMILPFKIFEDINKELYRILRGDVNVERMGEGGILKDFMGKTANLKRKGKYVMIDW